MVWSHDRRAHVVNSEISYVQLLICRRRMGWERIQLHILDVGVWQCGSESLAFQPFSVLARRTHLRLVG